MEEHENVKIELDPPKKLVVHTYYYVSLESFIDEVFSYPNPINVFWSDGVLFLFTAMDINTSEKLADDYMNGIMHWDYVMFCRQDKKINELKGDNIAMVTKVIDASNYHPHSDFAKYVKKRIIKA